MKQEDKELLLRDLCARLPYGVKVSKVVEDWTSDPHPIRSINLNNIIVEDGEFEDGTPDIDIWDYEDIKPYLFPLSSMTDEQRDELFIVVLEEQVSVSKYDFIDMTGYSEVPMDYVLDAIDWLNKNHFDYRGLIPMNLAIDATGLKVYKL